MRWDQLCEDLGDECSRKRGQQVQPWEFTEPKEAHTEVHGEVAGTGLEVG